MRNRIKNSAKFTGLNVFFVAATFLMVLNSAYLFSSFQKARENEAWLQHSNDVLSELELILSSVKDAETGMRGYLLTGDSSYLEPYYEGTTEVWAHFRLAKQLTGDNRAQQDSLAALQDIIQKRLQILADAIKGTSAAMAAPATSGILSRKGTLNEGKSTMDALRKLVDEMKSQERRLLAVRSEQTRNSQSLGYWSIIAATIINLLLSAAAYYFIRRANIAALIESELQKLQLWSQERLTELSQFVAGDTDTQSLSNATLEFFATHFNIPAATLYVAEGNQLRLAANYGRVSGEYSRVASIIPMGDGLLGQAIRNKKMTVINELPQDYFWVGSSLGQKQPRSLLMMPLSHFGKNVAIIEMALFEEPNKETMELFEKVREVIANGVHSSESRFRLQALLEKTQQQAEELQVQQEELRVSNEELEEQARQLEVQQETLNSRNSELERLNQYKSDFLAKMSHELRTPLNSLLILATLLRENKEGNLNEQQKTFASTIYDSGNDLLSLINDILDLSKIEARRLSIRAEAFSLQTLMAQLQSTFMPQISKKNLDFNFQIEPDIQNLIINSDPQRISQILRNFISNAIKFTEKGSIDVRVARSLNNKEYIDIRVRDSGIGIPKAQQDLIFNAFEQGDSSISRKFGGTGLGLTISRELSLLLGGEISVQSEEGRGSEFTLRIPVNIPNQSLHFTEDRPGPEIARPVPTPIKSEDASPEILSLLAKANAAKKTLLIIEDDQVFSHLVAETAETYGFTALEANTGEMGLQLLERFTPTAIMLDIKLPGISGFGILETIKEMPHLRHIPVHMISAMDYSRYTLRMGAMGFLGKPVSIDKLRDALSQLDLKATESTRNLLVVEDNVTQREAIEQLLNGPDIKLDAVGTGELALQAVRAKRYDCIVLDLALPDMTGKEFLEKLDEMNIPLPPVIVYTGKDLSRREEEYLRKYSESIILKGARSPERLLDEVNLFLHRVEDGLHDSQREILRSLRLSENLFRGKRALLVDDDLRNVFALTHVLESKGFQVVVARDGVEAVEACNKPDRYDVILMDLMMPRMDGFQAMAQIRELDFRKATPIIALTAKAMKGDHEKALEAGANDYLPKPINIASLMTVLKVWVKEKEIFA
ncbi:hypothetical protein AZI86_08370 [Bdellovibrio bacteriovorus]|uniref:histidine kinase n=1 Tax=Bdellovibrio bacteriovorus TaxID=959 RepID=A0A150WRA6_BDEBC|nr:response regulator [Bdellovibrio bacteriovorus]KYG67022.1 hypothetical protein AZI86_08370 [Bdellovibrio bacteriovorus]